MNTLVKGQILILALAMIDNSPVVVELQDGSLVSGHVNQIQKEDGASRRYNVTIDGIPHYLELDVVRVI